MGVLAQDPRKPVKSGGLRQIPQAVVPVSPGGGPTGTGDGPNGPGGGGRGDDGDGDEPIGPGKSKAIKNFDKTSIYQQIVGADSVEAVEDLERKIELIEAIQRVPMLETLPETALYFLEQELKFHRFDPKAEIAKLKNREHYQNLWLVVEGQVMVLGAEGNGGTRVVNILKKGEYFLDKPWNWAGLPVTEIKAIMPTQILQIPSATLNKIAKVSSGVRKRLKAMQLRMDKRAEKFGGEVGKIWNYLVRHGYSYSERVRVIRLDKCIDCDACYIGCETRHGHARIWKSANKFGLLRFPDACRTCEFQHCTQHCAGDHIIFDTTYREVLIKDTCTGCTHCEEDCPYGVIKMVEREDQPGQKIAKVGMEDVEDGLPAKGKGKKEEPKKKEDPKKAKGKKEEDEKEVKKKMIAIKCDHCFGHADMACVTPCPTGAIFDLSQRELFERVDLYGLTDAQAQEAGTMRPMVHENKPGDTGWFSALLWSSALLLAAILGWEHFARQKLPMFSMAFAYYQLIGQPDAQIHAVESVHGFGRWLGWIGSMLLSTTLMYVPRKRISVLFTYLGSRQSWLDVHIFMGLMGFVFATYHTTFKVGSNLFAVVFWACGLVVLTGIIGRYFYGQLPRTQAGNEMRLEDARAETAAIEGRLQQVFPDSTAYKGYLDFTLTEEQRSRGLFRTVFLMFQLDIQRNAKLLGLRSKLTGAGQSRAQVKEIIKTIKRKANLEQKILLYEKSRKVAKLWQIVHILAAIVMFAVLAFHIYLGVLINGWT